MFPSGPPVGPVDAEGVAGHVELVYWNPARPRLRGPLRRLPISRRVNNFGDCLAPIVVDGVRRRLDATGKPAAETRLLSLGSILHFAQDGDVIWGSGVNGKVDASAHSFSRLDVRAVRGPLTHDFLRARGIAGDELPYGDPALLLGILRPDLVAEQRRFSATVVQNLNDPRPVGRHDVLSPRAPVEVCLRRIARSSLVVGSCLHAIIVAEALGVPARAVRSQAEHEFKYADYYAGTGRPNFELAPSIDAALEAGGMKPPRWSADPLLAAFPSGLWQLNNRAERPGGQDPLPDELSSARLQAVRA